MFERVYDKGEQVGIVLEAEFMIVEVVEVLDNGQRYKLRGEWSTASGEIHVNFYERNAEDVKPLSGKVHVSARTPATDPPPVPTPATAAEGLPLPPTVHGRVVLPVKASLWNCTLRELGRLVEVERDLPFHPIHNENGGVFPVEVMLGLLQDDPDLYDVFAFAKAQGSDYLFASVLS